jgi:hypothetical protein
MRSRQKTLDEVCRAGLAALAKALGPVDMIRFLQQFDLGNGDYTKERFKILGNPSVNDLLAELKAKKGKKKGIK